jgi:ABC-type multidrug transport system permease subunit
MDLNANLKQIMPLFVTQRSLYEVRERPSKSYSWKAFLIANIFVEIPYQVFLGIVVFASYYYPIYTTDGIQSSERQGIILLFCIQFFIFGSTFAHALIAGLPDAETAGNIATFMFSLTLVFNGVMQPPQALPRFWIFMYRVSPLTYWVSGVASAGLAGKPVVCADNELAVLNPPTGQSCGTYLADYVKQAGGNLLNPTAMQNCRYCALSTSDQFLSSVAIKYDTRWRDFGIVWAYVVFNVFAAVCFYYFFRVAGKKSLGLGKVKGKITGLMRRGDRKGEAKEAVGKNHEEEHSTIPEGKEAENPAIV